MRNENYIREHNYRLFVEFSYLNNEGEICREYVLMRRLVLNANNSDKKRYIGKELESWYLHFRDTCFSVSVLEYIFGLTDTDKIPDYAIHALLDSIFIRYYKCFSAPKKARYKQLDINHLTHKSQEPTKTQYRDTHNYYLRYRNGTIAHFSIPDLRLHEIKMNTNEYSAQKTSIIQLKEELQSFYQLANHIAMEVGKEILYLDNIIGKYHVIPVTDGLGSGDLENVEYPIIVDNL